MFDMKQKPSNGDGVPVPLAGRAMMFMSEEGFLMAKMPDGSIAWPYGSRSMVCALPENVAEWSEAVTACLDFNEPGIVARGGAVSFKAFGAVEVSSIDAVLNVAVLVDDVVAVSVQVEPGNVDAATWYVEGDMFAVVGALSSRVVLRLCDANGASCAPIEKTSMTPESAVIGARVKVAAWLSSAGDGVMALHGGYALRVA